MDYAMKDERNENDEGLNYEVADPDAQEMVLFMLATPSFIFDPHDHNWSILNAAMKQLCLPITAEALGYVWAGLIYSGCPVMYDKTKTMPTPVKLGQLNWRTLKVPAIEKELIRLNAPVVAAQPVAAPEPPKETRRIVGYSMAGHTPTPIYADDSSSRGWGRDFEGLRKAAQNEANLRSKR